MIKPLFWPEPAHIGEVISPFQREASNRPLKLTLHLSSFVDLPPEELECLQFLQEFRYLSELKVLNSEPEEMPFMQVDRFDPEKSETRIYIKTERSEKTSSIYSLQFPAIASYIVHQDDLNHPAVMAMIDILLLAQAHRDFSQDIFVTMSPLLFENSGAPIIRGINLLTPKQAIKLVGLLLRSRENYTYRAINKGCLSFSRGLFYWVLARHKLPHMWRYFSGCVASEDIRRDNVLGLGESVLIRATRALQARDAIGRWFYVPQNNSTRDEIMYHFDFLTLLLAGAFDAQARIAHRAYRINAPHERNVNFKTSTQNGRNFIRSLERSGANSLCELVNSKRFQSLIGLLYTLRNSIHGATLRTLGYRNMGQPEASFVEIPRTDQDEVEQATLQWGIPDIWGIQRMHTLVLEPYTCACTLVENCFQLIDTVASATDITRLFPDGYAIPVLQEEPPNDDVFGGQVRNRIAILG